MGKRQNYGFQKRQKEIDKQKKRDEKAMKKRARREEADEASTTDGGESDDESDPPEVVLSASTLDPELRGRLNALFDEGRDLWDRFDSEVRQRAFHPFVAADYDVVLEALLPLRAPGRRFLEWGSATGVITIMADMLGFDAYGIEIDGALVDQSRELAGRTGSRARFAAGSIIPAGYRWKGRDGDARMGTIGEADSGYLVLGMPLDQFDVVFGFPWAGEEPLMLDLMKAYGRPDGRFLLHTMGGITVYRGGQVVA